MNSSETGPAADQERPLSVLIMSPDPRVHGGVSTFIEMMKPHLSRWTIESLWVGGIQGHDESLFCLSRRMIKTTARLLKLNRAHRFDVIHINPSLNAKSLLRDGLSLLALRLTGYRSTLIYFHGWQARVARRIQKNQLVRRLFVWLLNGSGHVMVLSPDFKATLVEMGVNSDRISFTRTMFDGASMRINAQDRGEGGNVIVLYLSRFERQKGVYELLEAFARVAVDYPKARLVMAGEGDEKAQLQAMTTTLHLDALVSFPGYVTGARKLQLLDECAIFALPTYFPEGMPVALLEALGAGKPVITAKAGAIGYIVKDPENGVVLDEVTVNSVETGLRKLLANADYRQETGRRNAEYAWREFEAGIVTAGIETVYKQIARTE